MSGLQLLSALNWAMALLYFLGLGGAALLLPMPTGVSFAVALGGVVLAAPHAWLGQVIEQGRGRGLQTVFAVLALFNVPLGTLFGLYALWVLNAEEHRDLFERGARPPSRSDDFEPAPAHETPWAMAQRLKRSGLRPGAIRLRLEQRGLEDDEVETLLNALGVSAPKTRSRRAPQR